MDAQRIEDVTEWDARSFSDGFSGLRALADRGFSGAVTDGSGWLFLLNGRVVGTADASLDEFADASGTAHRAPDESLPLLFAMQEAGGTQRAQYYTNDTPLSEADRKLSAGGFTGYVELADNVLSGDYYVTYTGGESRSVAFVGNSRRVETGEDAFELADDEVGIYTVYEVDLDVRDIPEPTDVDVETTDGNVAPAGDNAAPSDDEVEADDAGATSDDTEATGEPDHDAPGAVEAEDPTARSDPSEPTPGYDPGSTAAGDTGDAVATVDAESDDAADGDAVDDDDHRDADGPHGSDSDGRSETLGNEPTSGADTTGADASTTAPSRTDASGTEVSGTEASGTEVSGTEASGTDASGSGSAAGGDAGAAAGSNEDVFSEEEEWREARSIPALDPQESTPRDERAANDAHDDRQTPRRTRASASSQRSGSSGRTGGGVEQGASADAQTGTGPEPRTTGGRSRAAVSKRTDEDAERPEAGPSTDHGERLAELESALKEAEREREDLIAERDALAAERDEHEAERERLEKECERLKAEFEDLRAERDRLREELSQAREELPDTERTVSAERARNETNLFVRYGSKGGATLEDVHDGSVDRDALRENLRIEHHTGFESENAVVDGLPFREFLEGTMEYGFVRWLVEDLTFEIRDTDNESSLRELYEALPKVDRAEIGGSVSIVTRENGEEHREQRAFDLVLRDRMGNPLFIADLNASRDPTVGGTLDSLVASGSDVAQSNGPFAAAFAVTASFFEPDALEAAGDAVGGGLFSRSKRKSFVKISRKEGYHLCLVESRDGGFHLTVPDL